MTAAPIGIETEVATRRERGAFRELLRRHPTVAIGIAILAVLGLVAVNTTGIAVTAVFGPRLLGRLLVRR